MRILVDNIDRTSHFDEALQISRGVNGSVGGLTTLKANNLNVTARQSLVIERDDGTVEFDGTITRKMDNIDSTDSGVEIEAQDKTFQLSFIDVNTIFEDTTLNTIITDILEDNPYGITVGSDSFGDDIDIARKTFFNTNVYDVLYDLVNITNRIFYIENNQLFFHEIDKKPIKSITDLAITNTLQSIVEYRRPFNRVFVNGGVGVATTLTQERISFGSFTQDNLPTESMVVNLDNRFGSLPTVLDHQNRTVFVGFLGVDDDNLAFQALWSYENQTLTFTRHAFSRGNNSFIVTGGLEFEIQTAVQNKDSATDPDITAIEDVDQINSQSEARMYARERLAQLQKPLINASFQTYSDEFTLGDTVNFEGTTTYVYRIELNRERTQTVDIYNIFLSSERLYNKDNLIIDLVKRGRTVIQDSANVSTFTQGIDRMELSESVEMLDVELEESDEMTISDSFVVTPLNISRLEDITYSIVPESDSFVRGRVNGEFPLLIARYGGGFIG